MKSIATAVLAALSLVFVSACSTTDTAKVNSALDKVETGYLIAKASVGVYKRLAPCSDTRTPPLCYSPTVGAEIDKAMAALDVAIKSARDITATTGSDASAREKAIATAGVALGALLNVLATYGVAT